MGLKSKNHVILVALKRSTSDLSAYQKKVYPVDDHVGVSIAGLTADGRLLCNFMRTECLNSRYAFNVPLPVSRLVSAVGDSILYVMQMLPWQHISQYIILTLLLEMQHCTQVYGRRPYGVGMLIAGYDVSISLTFCLCS